MGNDLTIIIGWNTDRTDVDLHVVEPSGEECYYKNRSTKSNGSITADVTEGFGPEMYTIRKADHGKYAVKVNFYGSDANRTTARTKVYVTVYENLGKKNEIVTNEVVTLSRGKEMRDVATVSIKK